MFKIQAMNFIDSLRYPENIETTASQTSLDFNLRVLSPKAERTKHSDIFSPSSARKMSSETLKNRKFSHFHETMNEIKKRRESQDSTQVTQKRITSLKRTFNTIRNESEGKRYL